MDVRSRCGSVRKPIDVCNFGGLSPLSLAPCRARGSLHRATVQQAHHMRCETPASPFPVNGRGKKNDAPVPLSFAARYFPASPIWANSSILPLFTPQSATARVRKCHLKVLLEQYDLGWRQHPRFFRGSELLTG